MNEVTEVDNSKDLMNALRTSLYPGATDESIGMVMAYCRAAKLDPMQKPVHIVSLWDGDLKAMRDVVMPGIGLYRIQASRSGEYGGCSAPLFGPDITATVGGVQVTYPEWCSIIVTRVLKNGAQVDFTAQERWLENFAAKKDGSPNSMWMKRPYGQLAKCAEAQALRKAFPEFCSPPTAEEMEGKPLRPDSVDPGSDADGVADSLLKAESKAELNARFKIAWKDHPEVRHELTDRFNQRNAELDSLIMEAEGEAHGTAD